MPPRSTAPRRHDPFWDLDGAGARRSRTKRRFARVATWLIVAIVIAVVVTRLPSIDPEFLIRGDGRPLVAGALLALLGAAILLGLARVSRSGSH